MPEAGSRLMLEHKTRPTLQLKAVFASHTQPDAVVGTCAL